MGANEVLRFIELAALLVSGSLGFLTGVLAYKYRNEIKRAEKRRAVRKLRPRMPSVPRNHTHSEAEEHNREFAGIHS
jgi:hypothetical protein